MTEETRSVRRIGKTAPYYRQEYGKNRNKKKTAELGAAGAWSRRNLEGFLSPSNAPGHTTWRTRGEGPKETRKSEAACVHGSVGSASALARLGPLRPAPCLRSTSDLGAAARGWVRRGSPKRLRADARRCRAVRASGRANVALALARRRTQVRGRALAPP